MIYCKSLSLMALILITTTTLAQNPLVSKKNPYTLVYEGAITGNTKGQVHIQPVQYKLNGIDIVANIYKPANFDAQKNYPALVIAHPNGGVKEQTSGLYAQKLAEAGYITIVADAAFQGGSGGTPRQTDKPQNRINDIYGMADYISIFPNVDTARIGILGICAGGGYTIKASQSDKRLKAVATLSMFNSGQVRRNGFQNSQINTIQDRLEQANKARMLELTKGEVMYTGVADVTDEQIAKTTTDLYRQGFEYYYRTHKHPHSTFLYTTSSLLDLMAWDATDQIELLNQPLLMIAGSQSDSKYMTDEVIEKAVNAKDKELFIVDGATHIDTYWKPDYVNQIVEKLIEFYSKNL